MCAVVCVESSFRRAASVLSLPRLSLLPSRSAFRNLSSGLLSSVSSSLFCSLSHTFLISLSLSLYCTGPAHVSRDGGGEEHAANRPVGEDGQARSRGAHQGRARTRHHQAALYDVPRASQLYKHAWISRRSHQGPSALSLETKNTAAIDRRRLMFVFGR